MSGLSRVVVLVACVALLAVVQAEKKCVSTQAGNMKRANRQQPEGPYVIPANRKSYKIVVNTNTCYYNEKGNRVIGGAHLGTQVRVCDTYPTQVDFHKKDEFTVKRTKMSQDTAVVYVKVFCGPLGPA